MDANIIPNDGVEVLVRNLLTLKEDALEALLVLMQQMAAKNLESNRGKGAN